MGGGQCVFNERWFDIKDYESWLRKEPSLASDKTMAGCRVCKKPFSFKLSSMGIEALKSHVKGKIHQRNLKGSKGVVCSMDRFLNHSDDTEAGPSTSQ